MRIAEGVRRVQLAVPNVNILDVNGPERVRASAGIIRPRLPDTQIPADAGIFLSRGI